MRARTTLLLCVVVGCATPSGSGDAGRGGSDANADVGAAACTAGMAGFVCVGATAVTCNADGTEASRMECSAGGHLCVTDLGCVTCAPGTSRCDGDMPMRCRADGSGFDTMAACDASMGLVCSATLGSCVSACTSCRRCR